MTEDPAAASIPQKNVLSSIQNVQAEYLHFSEDITLEESQL